MTNDDIRSLIKELDTVPLPEGELHYVSMRQRSIVICAEAFLKLVDQGKAQLPDVLRNYPVDGMIKQ